MTTPTEDPPFDDPLTRLVARLELPEQGTGVRAARRTAGQGTASALDEDRFLEGVSSGHRHPSRWWMAVFSSCMVLAVGTALALTYVGLKTVRSSKAGRVVSTVTDPSAPGFEAFVAPTPTMVVLHEAGGKLTSAAVLTLNNGDAGGSVLLIPSGTVVDTPNDGVPLSIIFAFVGQKEDVREAVQDILGIGINEVAIVDDAHWAELVAPVAPLQLTNPDALDAFPAGPVSLAADQVGPWLEATRTGESDLARLFRQQLFWEAWANAVAGDSANPGVVPGEIDVGLGRFVRGLGNGPTRIATLPVTETTADGGDPRFAVDAEAASALISKLVPFPTGNVLGARTRVRLLDGTGDPQHVMRAAPLVVPADAEIVVAGNADRFDYTTTEIRYHDPTQKAAAERIRDALGTGKLVDDPRQTDAFDVTIVLGNDL